MQFELDELEEELLKLNPVPLDIKQRINVLRDFARTYDALCELVAITHPRTYQVMFEDEGEIIITDDEE